MDELDWSNFLRLGRQYEASATSKTGSVSKLSPIVVYNLLSMALENYCMAILACYGTLADNHTFTDLVQSLERVLPLEAELKRRVLELERHQQICSFADFVVAEVDTIVNREFQDVVSVLADIAHHECSKAA